MIASAALNLEPAAAVILVVLVVCSVLFVGVCLLGDVVGFVRRRRAQRHAAAVVRRRLDDVAALPAPDEIPRARDLTKGEVRQLRGRQHPVPRKRGSRRYGA